MSPDPKSTKGATKILSHPDKDEIIRELNDGTSVRKLSAYLKKKYKNKKHLQVSPVSLQFFRKGYLKLDGKVLRDIQESMVAKQREKEEQELKLELAQCDAYKEKITQIADSQLDVANTLLRLDKIIGERIKYYFNTIYSGDKSGDAKVADKEIRQYMDRQMTLLAQYKKFVEGMADKTIDYNVNINVLNDQLDLIKGVIREVLIELDPETSIKFMDKFNKKLNNIRYEPAKPEGVEHKEIQAINAEILEGGD